MSRFRNKRRRIAALALLPFTATMMIATGASMAAGSRHWIRCEQQPGRTEREVTLSGHFSAPKVTSAGGAQQGARDATQDVRIQFRAVGADNWHDAKRTETGRKGKFSERVGVSRSGRFRAVSSDGRATGAELVRVKSKTQARVSTKNAEVGDKVRVKGHVAPGAAGRKVVVKVGGERIRTRTGNSGKFSVAWKADSAGSYAVRVKADGDKIAAGSGRRPARWKCSAAPWPPTTDRASTATAPPAAAPCSRAPSASPTSRFRAARSSRSATRARRSRPR